MALRKDAMRLGLCCLLTTLAAGLWTPLAMAQESGGAAAPKGPPPATVRLDAVKSETEQERREIVGRLRARQRSVVACEQSGRVAQVPVDEGASVVAGQTVLAVIDPVWANLELASAKAEVAKAKASVAEATANLDQSTRDLHRLERLSEQQSAKPKEVDDARAAAQADQARLDSARALLVASQVAMERAVTNLSKLQVIAPFSGTVVKKQVEVGQWVAAGGPVVEIVSAGRIDGEIDVPEQLVNLLSIGQEVEIQVEPLRRQAIGKVRTISPMGDNAARTFPVRLDLDDQDGLLKPGMSILAHVPTDQTRTVLTVHRSCVVRSGSDTKVWANLNGAAMPILVNVLFGVDENRYAVATAVNNVGPSLADGMQLVVEGTANLFPTRPLVVAPSAAGPSAKP